MSTNGKMVITFVAKKRWVKKRPNEQMTIRNYEAIRNMCMAIDAEKASPPNYEGAGRAKKEARQILDDELKDYLSGQKLTLPMATAHDGFGYSDLGGVL